MASTVAVASLTWGVLLLGALSHDVARLRNVSPGREMLKHISTLRSRESRIVFQRELRGIDGRSVYRSSLEPRTTPCCLTTPAHGAIGLRDGRKRRIPDVIRGVVRAGQPGAYLLGYSDMYVGRSDTCLRTRLIAHELMYEVEYVACCFTPDVRRSFLQKCEFWRSNAPSFQSRCSDEPV